ncbi:mannitol dehydrogenase family protein [Nocardioides pantholopis]|uniref:mannitol dehydrogenase family protein n=1 Tax=Nocardioides pantholopis TaxID=2483798 RepID=UPI000FD9894D|nr:mannitol dehydrogenase family protein [Nocardioides pantholopis]
MSRDPVPLGTSRLASLGEGVAVPGYDRAGLAPGIVHLGVGGFHRAHEARYVDELLAGGGARDWGICGVGVRPEDQRMRDVLRAQDHLYTLVERHPDGSADARVIGSLVDYLFAPDDPEAVVEQLAAPTTRIVSLTITEGGYHLRPGDGEFDTEDPEIRRDLEPGAPPRTAFGLATEALRRRRARGLAPFTVLSCDNIEENGHVARRAFEGFAELRDPSLAAWISEAVAFPNSMVDRITPATTDEDRTFVAEAFGIADGWPVLCEPFSQWVIEDRFSAGRPPWEDAGVQVVDDVRPYELMKLRLLNAGHQVLAHLGTLAGHTFVHETSENPAFADLLLGYLEHEAGPTLDPVPGVDLGDYRRTLLSRFGNASIADTLARQRVDASERIPKFLLPVLREQLRTGGEIRRATLAVAAWAHCAAGVDDQGRPIELVDVRREEIRAAAARQRDDPEAMLSLGMFAGLRDDPRFVDAFVTSLKSLQTGGARAALDA